MLTLTTTMARWLSFLLLGVTVLLACVEKACAIMNTVAVERDSVVVIAGGNEGVLQEMNLQMRRIDLFCKLASPLMLRW
jgi:iron-regulated transporter 1